MCIRDRYKGSIREDDFFDMLHEDGMTIAGIKLDINPITEGKTGTMENYLPVSYTHLDVYKRQDLSQVFTGKNGNLLPPFLWMVICLVLWVLSLIHI